MKKLLGVLLLTGLIGASMLKAQPTDRPLHNFYVDKDDITIKYEQIFTATNMSAKVLAQKLRILLLKSDNVENLQLDTATNILLGHLKNIIPQYYQSSRSKELIADFTVEVKDGKYRVFIHDMYLENNGSTSAGYPYMMGSGPQKERLEEMSINSKGTKWKDFAYSVLPDLDNIFSKKFSLSGGKGDF